MSCDLCESTDAPQRLVAGPEVSDDGASLWDGSRFCDACRLDLDARADHEEALARYFARSRQMPSHQVTGDITEDLANRFGRYRKALDRGASWVPA